MWINRVVVSPYLSGSDGGLYVVLLFLGYPGMLGGRVVNNQHPDNKPHTTNGTWWNREPNLYLVSDEIEQTIHWHEVQANCNKNGFTCQISSTGTLHFYKTTHKEKDIHIYVHNQSINIWIINYLPNK